MSDHVCQTSRCPFFLQIPMDYEHITLNSFNCRGIRNSQKRKNIFNWLKNQHFGLTMLQETHSDESVESLWENEWGG